MADKNRSHARNPADHPLGGITNQRKRRSVARGLGAKPQNIWCLFSDLDDREINLVSDRFYPCRIGFGAGVVAHLQHVTASDHMGAGQQFAAWIDRKGGPGALKADAVALASRGLVQGAISARGAVGFNAVVKCLSLGGRYRLSVTMAGAHALHQLARLVITIDDSGPLRLRGGMSGKGAEHHGGEKGGKSNHCRGIARMMQNRIGWRLVRPYQN